MTRWNGSHTVKCESCGHTKVNTCTCNRDWCVACDSYCANKDCPKYMEYARKVRQ